MEGWFLGTFHSLATRLLRPHAELVGLKPNFTILGQDDQMRLIKQLLEAENIDDKKSPARVVLAVINRWKDRGLLPDDVREETRQLANGKMPKLYAQYQERLLELNACDFGDLLLHHLTILRNHPDILAAMHERFRYILVDEYQDTNVAQYLWLRLLAQGHKNICCVGDEDQSIYGWRGAEIGNILRFEEDFPGAEVIRLEQNYRSTGHILGAASHLIANNQMRLGKTLWTSAEPGEKVRVQTLWDGEEEARWVADEIESMHVNRCRLTRSPLWCAPDSRRASSRNVLSRSAFPIAFWSARGFMNGRKSATRWLICACSSRRKMIWRSSASSICRSAAWGLRRCSNCIILRAPQKIPLMEAAARLIETDELKPKLRATLRRIRRILRALARTCCKTMPHAEVAQIVLDESGYTGMWQADKSPEAPGRLENLKELVSAIAEFDTLPAFLEHVSLVLEATDKTAVSR